MILATLLSDPGNEIARRQLGERMAGQLVSKKLKGGREDPVQKRQKVASCAGADRRNWHWNSFGQRFGRLLAATGPGYWILSLEGVLFRWKQCGSDAKPSLQT